MGKVGKAAGGALSGAMAGSALGPWGMAGGALIGGLSGLFGSDDSQRWDDYYGAVGGLKPNDLQTLLSQGQTGPSAFAGWDGADPTYQGAMQGAVGDMMNEARQGGLGPQGFSQLQQAGDWMGQQNKGAQGAVAQQMQSAGQGGSPADFANRLVAQQGSMQSASRFGAQALGEAQKSAMGQYAQAAGIGAAGQHLKQQREMTSNEAKDKLAAFNAQARTGAYGQNWQENMQKVLAMRPDSSSNQSYQNQQDYAGDMGKAGGAALAGYFGGQKKPSGPGDINAWRSANP